MRQARGNSRGLRFFTLTVLLFITVTVSLFGRPGNGWIAFGQSALKVGDTVEVFNTGSSGLIIRGPNPCSPQIGGKFDGDKGTIIDGPSSCSGFTRWRIRWDDGLVGWAAEDWLRSTDQQTTPGVPQHSSPSSGATGVSTQPTFSWQSVPNADSYSLFVSQPPYGAANLVFDSESDVGPITGTTFTLPITLQEGVTYRWNMRARNNAGFSGFSTAWEFTTSGAQSGCTPGTGEFCAEYYNNRTLSGSPTFTQNEQQINHDWGNGGPGNGVGNDNFSARWQGRFNFEAENYSFITRSDDGFRLWVDNELLIDEWHNHAPTSYTATKPLANGEHEIKVDYYEAGGGAVAEMRWEKLLDVASCNVPSGEFCAEYYNNRTLSGSPTFTQNEQQINHDWASGGPGNGVGNDNFSVRWQGQFDFDSGDYAFTAYTDDGMRVWVDNTLVIDTWRDQPATTHTEDHGPGAGNYLVKVEYYERGGQAVAKVEWEKLFSVPPDPYAVYEPQSTCDPSPKPGVEDFRDLVLAKYPQTGDSGISRQCNDGGTSEHKEGRAWDWRVFADTQEPTVDDLLGWLLATRDGYQHAYARRVGIMYIIWNRQIWEAWEHERGWQPYTEDNPHTDHVHFSVSWDGARKQTTWWTD